MRDGRLMRAFTTVVGACCLAFAALGLVVQFHPAGPSGTVARSVQAAVLLSAVAVGLRWLLGPWPHYRQAVAFVVWIDAASAILATTMSTPEARLCATVYLGLVGGFVGLLFGGRMLKVQCGFCVVLIWGVSGWAVLFDHATFFGLFIFWMPALVWAAVVPLGSLVLIDVGRNALRRTAHAADRDPLTGLRNRRGMYAASTTVIRRSSPAVVTVAVCDIDRFKVLNDARGHAAGDAALLHIAESLRMLTREDEITARIGGDELVLVMFSADRADPAELPDRLEPLTHCAVDGCSSTASIGIASLRTADPHFSLDDVLRYADAAMYEAKRSGGGSCVVYHPSTAPDRWRTYSSARHEIA